MRCSDGLVLPSPSLLHIALSSCPGFDLPCHVLRRRRPSPLAAGETVTPDKTCGGGSLALETAMLLADHCGDTVGGNYRSTYDNSQGRASEAPTSTMPGLQTVSTVRGGSATVGKGSKRRRRRRPLRSFLAPALVWIVAAGVDYDLWWRKGSTGAASAASSLESDSLRFRLSRGRAAESNAAEGAAGYRGHFVCFHVLLGLALLSHISVMVADPGFLPRENQTLGFKRARESGRWCDECNVYKPPRAHHCRRCGGCVARMDHHCVYVANCIGAGNHKLLILLLVYSAACAAHANLLYLGFFLTCHKGSGGGGGGGETSGVENGGQALFTGYGLVSAARKLLPVLPLLVFLWLIVLLGVQLYGIGVDAGIVDRLQAATAGYRAEEVGVFASHATDSPTRVVLNLTTSASRLPDDEDRAGFGDRPPNFGGTAGVGPSKRVGSTSVGSLAYRFSRVFEFPRGPSSEASSDGDDGDERYGAVQRAVRFCVELSRTLREEILGQGPWLMWFVPTPARLSSEVEERFYSPYNDRATKN